MRLSAHEMKMDLIVIRNYISEIPANLAKATLEGSGIDVMIRKDDCGGMRPYLQSATGVQVLVCQKDVKQAEEILRHAEEQTEEKSAEQCPSAYVANAPPQRADVLQDAEKVDLRHCLCFNTHVRRRYEMPTATDRVVEDALELPADARIGLVERILASLNLPTRPDIDKMWSEEAERRVAEIDRGEVELIPGEEVFANIRRKYAR